MRALSLTHNTPLKPHKTLQQHHLAFIISSPARHSAAARHRARMILQNHTSQPQTSSSSLLTIPNTRHPISSIHVTTTQSVKHTVAALTQASAAQQAQAILPRPQLPWLRRCSNQQQPRACFDQSWSRRQAAQTNKFSSKHYNPKHCPLHELS